MSSQRRSILPLDQPGLMFPKDAATDAAREDRIDGRVIGVDTGDAIGHPDLNVRALGHHSLSQLL